MFLGTTVRQAYVQCCLRSAFPTPERSSSILLPWFLISPLFILESVHNPGYCHK